MGTARYARPGDRLRPSLERPHGDRAPEVHSWAGSGPQQVLRQRTQQLDSARLLAGGLGEARHPGLSRALSAGRLSPAGKSSNWSLRATGTRKWGRSSSSANRPSKTTPITFSTSSAFLTGSSWPSTPSTTDWLRRGSIIRWEPNCCSAPPASTTCKPHSSRGRGRPELCPSRLRDHGSISGLISGVISGSICESISGAAPSSLLPTGHESILIMTDSR